MTIFVWLVLPVIDIKQPVALASIRKLTKSFHSFIPSSNLGTSTSAGVLIQHKFRLLLLPREQPVQRSK